MVNVILIKKYYLYYYGSLYGNGFNRCIGSGIIGDMVLLEVLRFRIFKFG